MIRTLKNNLIVILAVLLVAFMFMAAITSETAYAENIPDADVTYTSENDWEGTLALNTDCTVLISGITHDNSEYNGSVIKISNNSTVNLVFEGQNVLTANSSFVSAGIEVEEGSTVNIYGKDGSALIVTGGKYSAAIGGLGYNSVGANNPRAGKINIYSGTITAKGGDRAAGIGSGYHASASEISIKGGDVTALGKGGGAGIGSGYGTSGGAAAAAGVGYYNGGNITISGGTVRAAAWYMNFDNFDQYDPQTLYGDGYQDTFAAGIGGGYGASSGNIVIEGDAEVIALGSCGGAGIGTGRGTSKSQNYDTEHAYLNVVIKGNAKVVAMSTEDRRQSVVGDTGGAGIGLGRGWGFENQPVGSIVIDENANVYAYAESGANGIGASSTVGKYTESDGVVNYPPDAHVEDITIGPSCTVVAECGQPEPERAAFDEVVDPTVIPTSILEFCEGFIENAGIGSETPFFTEDKLPMEIEIHSTDNQNLLATLILDRNGEVRVGIHIPNSYAGVYYKLSGAEVDGRGVLLAHSENDNGWKFENGENYVTNLLFERYNITYNLNGGKNVSANPKDYAVYEPAVNLSDPSRSGYTFKGWYDNAEFKGDTVKSIPSGSVGDKTFWAKWEKNPAPVTNKVILMAKLKAKDKTSLVLSWNKIKKADGYDIFFIKCAKGSLKKVKTIKNNSTTTWTKKGLKKNAAYKARVKAYVIKSGKKTYIKTSPVVHAYTSGGTKKYTNAKSVTVSKTSITLKKGKTYTIKATVNKLQKGKKLMGTSHAPKLRYKSTSTKVARVSKTGKITAKGKGTCYIYVYAVNGVSKKITLTVK